MCDGRTAFGNLCGCDVLSRRLERRTSRRIQPESDGPDRRDRHLGRHGRDRRDGSERSHGWGGCWTNADGRHVRFVLATTGWSDGAQSLVVLVTDALGNLATSTSVKFVTANSARTASASGVTGVTGVTGITGDTGWRGACGVSGSTGPIGF